MKFCASHLGTEKVNPQSLRELHTRLLSSLSSSSTSLSSVSSPSSLSSSSTSSTTATVENPTLDYNSIPSLFPSCPLDSSYTVPKSMGWVTKKRTISAGGTTELFTVGKEDMNENLLSTTSSSTTTTVSTIPTPESLELEIKKNLTAMTSSTTTTSSPAPSLPLESVVIGLSHHNTQVSLREKVAIPQDQWKQVADELIKKYESIEEAVVISTCNRFEIYLSGRNQYEMISDAIEFIKERTNNEFDEKLIRKNLFLLSNDDATEHLLRVASGLDSLIIGEGQILAQVKKASELSAEASGKILSRLFNTAIKCGKRVRTETNISKGAVSISSAAIEFSLLKLENDCNIKNKNLDETSITIVGAGKMTRLLLIHLMSLGLKKVLIVNRSEDSVKKLQEEFLSEGLEIEYQSMDKLYETMAYSDIVYTSTSAVDPIILKDDLLTKTKQIRDDIKNKKINTNMFKIFNNKLPSGGLHMVDISVPRNIAPEITTMRDSDLDSIDSNTDNSKEPASLTDFYVYNVDDLKQVVESNTMKRKQAILESEYILEDELNQYKQWKFSLNAIPTIHKLQEKAESLRQNELNKILKKLKNSKLNYNNEELTLEIEKVTKGIIKKLLHGPMNHLRKSSSGSGSSHSTSSDLFDNDNVGSIQHAIHHLHQAFQLDP